MLEWVEYVTNATEGRRIYDSDTGVIVDDKYDVTRGSQSYDLVVKNTTVETSGMYACRLMNANLTAEGSLLGLSEYRQYSYIILTRVHVYR